MRSKIPFHSSEVENRPHKLHDVVAFYRESKTLQSEIDASFRRSVSGSYDYGSYSDIKPESMDNPPIQHVDRLRANLSSRDPIVHSKMVDGYIASQKSESGSQPATQPAAQPAVQPAAEPSPAPSE